jgi:hypothetical protein
MPNPLKLPQPKLGTIDWLATLDAIVRATKRGPMIEIDLKPSRWIAQMPLLAICLGIQHLARHYVDRVRLVLPDEDKVRAFLERWDFQRVCGENRVEVERRPAEHRYGEASGPTRVLPIHLFQSIESVVELRDFFRRADTEPRKILQDAAQLQERDIRGLADLIIFELCKNAVEHRDRDGHAFIFGRMSPANDKAREHHPPKWEKAFFEAIGNEGMTEIVIGDGGVGIIESLRDSCPEEMQNDPEAILREAFEPFSTRKLERAEHTRGLWAVKQKVRQLRGLLYVRSGYVAASGEVRGIATSWDFLNEPGRDVPTEEHFLYDDVPFGGTQYQIILPHRGAANVNTQVAWHRARAARIPKLIPDVYQLPSAPPVKSLRRKLLDLPDHRVLFIDMSLANEQSWGHHLDQLAKDVAEHRAAGRALRVWLLNPSKNVIEQLRVSTYFHRLWRDHGLVQPFVTMQLSERMEVPPQVDFLVSDPALTSGRDDGDTQQSRALLREMLSRTVQGYELDLAKLNELDADEREWVELALDRNNAVVAGATPDASGRLTPAFDVEKLSYEAVTLLMPRTITSEVERLLKEQQATPCVFQLPSKVSPTYCTSYIPPTILKMLPVPTVAAVNEWIEQQIRDSRARYAISFSAFGRELLAIAASADRNIELILLQHHVPTLPEIDAILPGSRVVVLATISGAARTLEHIAQRLRERNIVTTIVCVIDTVTEEDRGRLPTLALLDAAGQFKALLPRPIEKYTRLDDVPGGGDLPISAVDPETLLPLAPVSALRDRMSDGAFWRMVIESEALSNEPVTYKGIDYTNLIWVKNLFDHDSCIEKVHEDFMTAFGDRENRQFPDIICLTQETWEAAHDSKFWDETLKKFPAPIEVRTERTLTDDLVADLEGKQVVIFAAASSSGGGIGRLIRRLQTARRLHLSIFINRVPEAILSSFVRLQQPRVSVTSFRRLYSHSPELARGSARSVSLRYLKEYRASCLSNRLLLFVQEKERLYQRSVAVQTPDELAAVCRPLRKPAKRGIFVNEAVYDLGSHNGRENLAHLVRSCEEMHTPWLLAILEEVAAREDASGRDDLSAVMALYKAAAEMRTKQVILQTLVLDRDRWHGRSQIQSAGAKELGAEVFEEFKATSNPEARCVCIRALSKLNRSLLFDALEEIIELSTHDRTVELTLALELTKLVDDEHATEDVIARLSEIVSSREHVARPTEFDVSLRNLMNDIGLERANNHLLIASWETVARALWTEPPDEERTVRFLIRSLRRAFGHEARILFYRWISDNRYQYADSWPPRTPGTLAPVPQKNILAHELIGQRESFYTPWLARDDRQEVRSYLARLRTSRPIEAKEIEHLGMVLYKIDLGEGIAGVLRIFLPAKASPDVEIVEEMRRAVRQAARLIKRSTSDLPKIGEWQYLRMIERAQTRDLRRADESLIPAFAEQLASLLGADMVTLLAFDEEQQLWVRKPVPTHWSPVVPDVAYGRDDPTSMTVAAAKERNPIKHVDAQAAARKKEVRPPVEWVHGCVALPLIYQARECRYVINLWHHVHGWFDQYSDDLLFNLMSIGGFFVEMITRYRDDRAARAEVFKVLTSESAKNEIFDLLLTCELLTSYVLDNGADERYSLQSIRAALEALRRTFEDLLRLQRSAGSESDPVHLRDLVSEVAEDFIKTYGDVKYRLKGGDDFPAVPVDVPIIRRVVRELLKNARTHAQPATHIEIVLEKETNPPAVRLEVSNYGYGVPNSLKQAIFDGPGIGLTIAKLAAENHGGRLEEVGQFKKRASFRLTLPVRTGS